MLDWPLRWFVFLLPSRLRATRGALFFAHLTAPFVDQDGEPNCSGTGPSDTASASATRLKREPDAKSGVTWGFAFSELRAAKTVEARIWIFTPH
jgi:hypothetical protein